MDLSDIFGNDYNFYIKNPPFNGSLDQKLSHLKFINQMKKRAIEYFSKNELKICRKSNISYYGRNVFECHTKDNIYYNPKPLDADSYRLVAEIDLAILRYMNNKINEIYIFEHKKGAKILYDNILMQLTRYLILLSYIFPNTPIIGYTYLGESGNVSMNAISINKDDKYFLVLVDKDPNKFSQIIEFDKNKINQIILEKRSPSEKIIKDTIYSTYYKN